MAVGGQVERLGVVQQLEHVRRRRRVDDRGRDELVHGFVVGRVGRVVHQAGAAAVDRAGEEGHADGFLVRDALEGADKVGALEVLGAGSVSCPRVMCMCGEEGEVLPWIRASTGRGVRRACQCLRMD